MSPVSLSSWKCELADGNEVNIWSHGLASIAFLAALVWSLQTMHMNAKHVPAADIFAVFIFLTSTIFCFLFSASHHLLIDHSEPTSTLTGRFDHVGIVLPMWGTTIASTHFGFYCDPQLQSFYWYVATGFALLCALATFHPMFRTPAGRQVRVLLYVLLGASSFVPIVRGVRSHGYSEYNRRMGLSYFIGLGVFHATGAAIYGARVPERFWPKRFDILGSSHQIMHLLVVCGALCYSIGLMKAFIYWNGMREDGTDICKMIG
ncbi:Hly-III related protein [Lophiostoma macrostomum CBS 122681]|uniref:Hly-III related protein n=1 Tax=Lophiostoma macrostomum CBS 122681 TaxID=1314788 RepID=A0A6A6T0F5_9PLEO|nr:Hly-III related protein [Lophiostoma macrostomum CBS 122681]